MFGDQVHRRIYRGVPPPSPSRSFYTRCTRSEKCRTRELRENERQCHGLTPHVGFHFSLPPECFDDFVRWCPDQPVCPCPFCLYPVPLSQSMRMNGQGLARRMFDAQPVDLTIISIHDREHVLIFMVACALARRPSLGQKVYSALHAQCLVVCNDLRMLWSVPTHILSMRH